MRVNISLNSRFVIDRREISIKPNESCEAVISAETIIECETYQEATEKTKEFSQEFKEYIKSLREGSNVL